MGKTVTLAALEGELRAENYPLSSEAVREAYGDYVLDLAGGEEPVADALDRVNDGHYADAAAVVATIQGGVGAEGVGRSDYSDRGGIVGENTTESF